MPYDFTTWDRNCQEEQATPIQGNTSGSLPPWLRGAYIINGPGRMTYGDSEFLHVFDGSAILQKYNIGETGVTYSSRFLKSYAFMTNSESEQIVVSEFGTKGCSAAKSKLAKLGDKFAFDKMFSDNAPVSLVRYGEDYYATTESPFVHKIDPSTLETISKVDLHKELSINSVCPHPVPQPDGTVFSIIHGVGAMGPKYDVVSFPAKPLEGKSTVFAKPQKIGSVDARWKFNPCHMHTFGVTPNYVVLLEQPLTIDVKAMVANTIREKPFIGGMEWMENKLVKIHLIERSTGKEVKTKVKCEPFFYLHIINTYEMNDQVVIDICGYDKPNLLHALFIEKIRMKGPSLADEIEGGYVKRIIVPLNVMKESSPDTNLVTLPGSKATALRQKDGVVLLKPETICNTVYENPTINPSKSGQPYRYYWGAEGAFKENCGKVGKVDMESGNVMTWQEENFFSAEAHFVPRPGAVAEDDGVVLVPGLFGGARRNETMLVILNAADMTEIYRSTFSLPSDASRALHGIFIPA